MRHARFLLSAIVICALAASAAAQGLNSRRARFPESDPTRGEAVLAIFTRHWRPPIRATLEPADQREPFNYGPRLIFALYDSGEVIWSEDQLKGGPPYRRARVPKGKVAALLGLFESKNFFANGNLNYHRLGPDSPSTRIVVRGPERWLDMASWHELFGDNKNLIATSWGISTRASPPQTDPNSLRERRYREFRAAWSEIRALCLKLIEGDPGEPAAELKLNFQWIQIDVEPPPPPPSPTPAVKDKPLS